MKLVHLICLVFLILFGLNAFASGSLYDDLVQDIDIVVDASGSGDFTTVQAAIDAVPNNSPERTVVFIKKGRYYEKVRISSSKINLVLIGEDMDSTIITYDDYAAVSGFDCTTVRVDANDFLAMNITFENGYDKRDSQALAMATYGDRQTFAHCRFNGYQDTYFSGSNYRAHFKDCLIIGDVDFIYGPTTILFDSCQIHNVRDGAYYTAASTPQDHKFGYVFKNCWISTDEGVENVWLGRPWRPYAHVAWFECYMDAGINPAGWNNWGDPANEETARYEEYNCSGPGADTAQRVDWGKQLTDEEAKAYTIENIYSKASNPSVGADWIPDIENDSLYGIIKKHTVKFLDPKLSNGRLTGLKVNGADVPGFHPDSLRIGVELPEGTTEIPEILPQVSSDAISYEIVYPDTLPGFAEVNVFTPYRIQNSEYEIFLSIDSAYNNANLKSLAMYNRAVPNFDPSDTTYLIGIPDDSPPFMRVSAPPQVNGAWVRIYRPDEIPGQYKITVKAIDNVTTKSYYIDVIYGGVLSVDQDGLNKEIDFKFENPTKGQLKGTLSVANPGDYFLTIYTTSGQKVFSQSFPNVTNSGIQFNLDLNIQPGLYIYKVHGVSGQYSGRLIQSVD